MVEHYKPKDLFAVVMDAHTGEILAYSQRPTFNPETTMPSNASSTNT
jgi:penicillin-binding protein 1